MIDIFVSLMLLSSSPDRELLALHGTDLNTHWETVKRVHPQYPRQAARRRIQGCARIGFVVESDGTVGETRILQQHPEPAGFGKAAERSVKKWRFEATADNPDAVPVYTTQMISFMIGDMKTVLNQNEAEAPCQLPAADESA